MEFFCELLFLFRFIFKGISFLKLKANSLFLIFNVEGISFVKKEGNFNERDFSFKIDSDVFDAVGRVDGDQ